MDQNDQIQPSFSHWTLGNSFHFACSPFLKGLGCFGWMSLRSLIILIQILNPSAQDAWHIVPGWAGHLPRLQLKHAIALWFPNTLWYSLIINASFCTHCSQIVLLNSTLWTLCTGFAVSLSSSSWGQGKLGKLLVVPSDTIWRWNLSSIWAHKIPNQFESRPIH